MSNTLKIRLGNCINVMQGMEEGSIDSIITDPPYFIGFMGKAFDKQSGADKDPQIMREQHEQWLREAYRVLKPGGIIKAFSAARTFHRLIEAMVNVGFTDIDLEAWTYGSGFPKSLNIQKAFAKQGKTKLAERYQGYGSNLKPAHEPIVLGTKSENG